MFSTVKIRFRRKIKWVFNSFNRFSTIFNRFLTVEKILLKKVPESTNRERRKSMLKLRNHVGTITISREYFTMLIGSTVTNCFGVVQMNVEGVKQTLNAILPFHKKNLDCERGIDVKINKDKITIDLHITVLYGVNINTVVRSIMNKVRYTVEEGTGIEVEKVNVYVDGIKI